MYTHMDVLHKCIPSLHSSSQASQWHICSPLLLQSTPTQCLHNRGLSYAHKYIYICTWTHKHWDRIYVSINILSTYMHAVYCKSFKVKKFTVAKLDCNSMENIHSWLYGQAYCTSYFTGKVLQLLINTQNHKIFQQFAIYNMCIYVLTYHTHVYIIHTYFAILLYRLLYHR